MMKVFLPIILVIYLSACTNNGKQPVALRTNEKDSTSQISDISGHDAEMNAAMVKAKQTYPEFLEVLKKGCDECDVLTVKMRFGYGEEGAEHMWLDNLHFRQDKLYGVLANVPEHVTNVDIGDSLEVKIDSLSDWMYVKKGTLVGGFTLKVIYDRMGDLEKKQLEEEIGAKIR